MKLDLFPGAVYLSDYISLSDQAALAVRCASLGSLPAGLYTPTLKTGQSMSIQTMSMGLHWNPHTYSYGKFRDDYDGAEVVALPEDLAELASRVAQEAGFPSFSPDIGILNYYDETAKLGLHQDRSERRDTIERGSPVVSLSLGLSCNFVVGGLERTGPTRKVKLRSGDAFVFGGPSRSRFHGVTRVFPNTSPMELGLRGRYNLTFREY